VIQSATQAGLSSPSISMVMVRVTWTVLGSLSSTAFSALATRMLDPTFTGLMKRTLSNP
jgi:hypothetical protein